MKKFIKVCGITVLILCLAGLVMVLVAVSTKGTAGVEAVVEQVTGGRVHVNLDFLGDNWGISPGRLAEGPDAGYEIDSSLNFNQNQDIFTGDVEKMSLGTEIEALEAEAGGCSFEIEASPDEGFNLEAYKAGKLQVYAEDGKLYIVHGVTSQKWDSMGNSRVILYVPENTVFKTADLELGAGSLKAKSIRAEELILDIGAGQMALDYFETSDLTVDVGLGELQGAGRLGENADIECAMGNVELSLQGVQTDYNYDIEGAMGSIDIGAESYSGFEQAKKIENGAGRTITLDCSMGNITLTFQ